MENIFANDTSDKGLISKIYKELLSLILNISTCHSKTAIFLLLFYFLLLFKYSCLHFTPTTPPHHTNPHFPPLILSPFSFSMCSLCMFLLEPSTLSYVITHFPSAYSQFVFCFNVSGYIFLACFFS